MIVALWWEAWGRVAGSDPIYGVFLHTHTHLLEERTFSQARYRAVTRPTATDWPSQELKHMKSRASVLMLTVLVAFSAALTAQAASFTDRENIQDGGMRISNSEQHDTEWVPTTAAATGSYYTLSQFDISDVTATVDAATLDLWLRDAANTGATRNISVYLLDKDDEDWIEAQATGLQKSTAAGMWAGGSRPYDAGGASVVGEWTPSSAGVRESLQIDVTDLVQQMIDDGRLYGTFYITDPDMPDWQSQTTMGQKEVQWERGGGASDYATQLLSVTSSGASRYSLTVISGTTSRLVNPTGSVVNIDANAPPQYYSFDAWAGDVTGITDLNAASTTMTTQATEATITATYAPTTFSLTVDGGSGGGVYDALSIVPISAATPATGDIFYLWLGDTDDVAETADSNTTITMYGDATVTATYRPGPIEGDLNGDGLCDIIDLNMVLIDWSKSGGFADARSDVNGDGTVDIVDLNTVLIDWSKRASFFLTVISGSGSGLHQAGEPVDISADAPPTEIAFNAWVGDVATVANVAQSNTNMTLTADATITATYATTYYTLTVNSGSGDGSYTLGYVASISADSPPPGEQFNAWVGDTAGIASALSSSTTITIQPSDATITATYVSTGVGAYTISVVGGSGSGSYDLGDTVYITAAGGSPDANELFTWTGNVGALAAGDVTNWDTSFVITSAWPAGYYNPWTITANYIANDTPGIKTDYGVYPEPPLPIQPAAGGKYIDPTFGTEIMRVTDQFDGSDCHSVEFSTWQAFNADTTMFYVMLDGTATLYDLNKTAFTISNKRNLFQSSSPDGALRVWDLNWDNDDPNYIYGHIGLNIYRYDVVANSYALIVDLASKLGSLSGAAHITYLNMDDYNDRFTFMVHDSAWNKIGSAVYDRSLDQVIFQLASNPHAPNLDKSGSWWSLTEEGEPGGIALTVVEMANLSNVQDLTKGSPDYAPGHCDWGWETVYGAGGTNQITKRNLATPHSWSSIFSWSDWSQAYHISNRDNNDDWIVVSAYGATIPYKYTDTRKFKDEIFQVKTDGSGDVRRLAHHRTLNPEGNVSHHYYDFPLASISPDGQFIIYNSNWENTKGHAQRDAYIVKIPIAP